ncbi:MAG: sugar phosphate isomerase/epimerase family protein [Bacillota bacterium]|nr:sugar phosphate isomerase/epimerase family protein [Bacillota bacterium]
MRLSTSTNIMDRVNKVSVIPMEDCIERCYNAGYRVLDMNFCDMSTPGMPMALDNWQSWVDKIGNLAAKLGVEFTQSHSHFYNVAKADVEDREWREELVRRAIIGSGMLGTKWMVLHSGTVREEGYSMKESKRKNIEYLNKHLELSRKHNVGICVENLFDNTPNFRKYTATAEELIDLVDTVNDPYLGICWDFGHGNLMGVSQALNLRKVGKRLKAIHAADNNGIKDEHLLPLYGNIDWNEMMHVLKEIGYENDFAFEITPFVDKIPAHIRDTFLRHTVEVGEYLLSLAI